MGFLEGKRALIVGVAGSRSIATGIAEAMHREGAQLAFACQAKLQSRAQGVADTLGVKQVLACDLSSDDDIRNLVERLSDVWPSLDIIVHSAAFAPADQLQGDFLSHVTREGFRMAHDISSYSFAALAQAARPMLQAEGACLALSYLGAVRAVPHYNVMGLAKASLEANVRYMAQSLGPEHIRVNAISAGPIRTLAASGIQGFRQMLSHHAATAPLRRNVQAIDVGNTAAFLCSDLARGITGQIVYVDSGFGITGSSELATN